MNTSNLSWLELISQSGIPEVNAELDKRFKAIFETLRDLTSAYTSDGSLTERVMAFKGEWLAARDQYERTVIRMASLNGNTRLVRCLIYSGCPINIRDGIGQTPLTVTLHMGHTITAKFILESGASVRDCFFQKTVSPLKIAKVKEDTIMISLIENKIKRGHCSSC